MYFYSIDYKHTAQLYENMKKLFKDVPQLISRIGILELVVVIIVMIVSFIYVRKPVRQLR